MDDMAAASVYVMNLDQSTFQANTQAMQNHINVGYGSDISIAELAKLVAKTVGYQGTIDFDTSKPDGTPRKLMDSSLLNALGWRAGTTLEAGLKLACQDFVSHRALLRT